MERKILWAGWGGMFVLCGILGLVRPGAGWYGTAAGILCFVPGFLLAYRGDRRTRHLVGLLSGWSLGLTAVLIVANLLSASAPRWVGDFLHVVLGIVSSPMLLCGSWALSLFLWACLMLWARKLLKAGS